MQRWLVLLSLSVLPIVGCQAAVSPGGAPTVREQQAAIQSHTFATQWRRRGWGRGWRHGFYGGFGYRPFVATPFVTPIITAPVIAAPVIATPVVSTVVYPTFAGAYGYFW